MSWRKVSFDRADMKADVYKTYLIDLLDKSAGAVESILAETGRGGNSEDGTELN